MKQVLIKKGKALVEEVPAPTVGDDSVLVQVFYSCISVGTELSSVSSSGESLLRKALNQPEKVMKVVEKVKCKDYAYVGTRIHSGDIWK